MAASLLIAFDGSGAAEAAVRAAGALFPGVETVLFERLSEEDTTLPRVFVASRR